MNYFRDFFSSTLRPVLEKTKNVLTPWDYLSFVALLAVSALVGVYFAVADRKTQGTTTGYFLGNRSMHPIPTAFSLMASFISAIIMLGGPAEVYTQNTMIMYQEIAIAIVVVISSFSYIPFFLNLQLTSIYEYFTLRYQSESVKIVANILSALTGLFYMSIALFAPSLALETVTGLPLWVAIVATGLVGIFYTSFGGIKAVIWTDFIQTFVMFAGQLSIFIMATVLTNGVWEVFSIGNNYNRINFYELSLDPTVRHTVFSCVVSGTFGWFGTMALTQTAVQRYIAIGSISRVILALVVMMFLIISFNFTCYLTGLSLFSYYNGVRKCDPIRALTEKGERFITNDNQIAPYFVMDKMAVPAIPGIYIAALYSGALRSFVLTISSVSSSLNSGATTLWNDLFKNLPWFRTFGERGATITSKLIVLVYGLMGIGLAFGIRLMSGTILQLSLTFSRMGSAGLNVAYFMGTMFPFTNWIGAIVGPITASLIQLTLGMGQQFVGMKRVRVPFVTDNCPRAQNSTLFDHPERPDGSVVDWVFSISYQWFPFIATFFGLVVGILVSLATGGLKEKDSVDPRYLFKWSYRLFVNKARVKPITTKITPIPKGDGLQLEHPLYTADKEQKAKLAIVQETELNGGPAYDAANGKSPVVLAWESNNPNSRPPGTPTRSSMPTNERPYQRAHTTQPDASEPIAIHESGGGSTTGGSMSPSLPLPADRGQY